MAQFFINRPIFAWVIAIVIMLAGGLAVLTLPVEQFPNIAPPRVTIELNLKPALTPEVLDKRLQRDFAEFTRKQFKNSLGELLPLKLIPVIIRLSGIAPDKPVHQITREERRQLAETLQDLLAAASGRNR